MSDDRILDKFGATLRIGDVIRDSTGRLFQSRVFMGEGKSGFVPSDLFGNATSDVKIYALNDDNTINSQFKRIISDFERVRSFADTEGGYQYKKGGLTSAELAQEIFRNQNSDGQFRFTEDQIYQNLDYFGKQARYEYDEDELEWNKYDRGGQLEAMRVKVLLQEAEQNLRRAGGLLYQNNHPNSDEFIRLYRDFEDRLQKILTPRKRIELNYAKGGKTMDDKVSDKIRLLKDEGYGQEQAVAIALSMRDRGKLERGGLSRRQESILRNSSLQIEDGGSALNILDNAEGISEGDKDEIRVISEQAKRLAMELDDIYNQNKK